MKNLPDLTFTYILLTDNLQEPEMQVFMGYTTSTLGVGRLVAATINLHPSVFHIHLNSFKIAKLKIRGLAAHRVFTLLASELPSLGDLGDLVLPVVLTNGSLDRYAKNVIQGLKFPVLHVTSDRVAEILDDPQQGRLALRAFARKVSKFRGGLISSAIDTCLKRRKVPELSRIIPRTSWGHGVTCINEIPLEATGGKFLRSKIIIAGDESRYVSAIKESVDAMKHERARMSRTFKRNQPHASVELILASPGLMYHISSAKRFSDAYGREKSTEFQAAFKFHIEQVSYFNELTSDQINAFRKNPFFLILAERWKSEIETFTSALAFQAFNSFCPVIRLPRRVYQIRGQFILLGNSLRSKSPHAHSINRAAGGLANALTKEIEPYNEYIEGANKHIRVCCDLPLGLAQINGVSLALRHHVSYLPTTPGNLFIALSLLNNRLGINITQTLPVTVIRSFRNGDPIKKYMETYLADYSSLKGWDIDLTIIDVATEDEFIEACNSCRGPIMIFDGHGSHSDETQVGSISIRGTDLDVWKLRKRVSIPPIVILSCCDSSSADRSHASTALGFLTLGAASVLGAMFPIGGISAASFVARLLYKITSTSRILIDLTGRPMSWSELVSCQLRATYVTELMRLIVKFKFVSEDRSLEIEARTVTKINKLDPDWHENLIEEISQESKAPVPSITNKIFSHLALPHALQYVHYGIPERITLITDRAIAYNTQSR